MHTWEDGTPKSMNNAFNWRDSTRATKNDQNVHIPMRAQDLSSAGHITVYSKATRAEHRVPPKPTSKTNITYSRKAKK